MCGHSEQQIASFEMFRFAVKYLQVNNLLASARKCEQKQSWLSRVKNVSIPTTDRVTGTSLSTNYSLKLAVQLSNWVQFKNPRRLADVANVQLCPVAWEPNYWKHHPAPGSVIDFKHLHIGPGFQAQCLVAQILMFASMFEQL